MRSEPYRAKFVVNPASANGSTKRAWGRIEQILRKDFDPVDVSFTAGANHATELARKALRNGAEMVVAVGGDGTINEVVNGFFDSGALINPGAVLGVISRGTGSDFIKTLGIPKQIEAACQTLVGRAAHKCDVGKFTCLDRDGRTIERYFINIADFGIGGETVERVNRTTKAFGGFASFLYGALSTLVAYKGKRVKVKVDDVYESEKLVNNVVVANGQFFGGGMWIAPRARVDDGLFDILVIEHMSLLESLNSIPKLYKGSHIENPKVKYLKGKTVIADSADVVLLDVEGEQVGRLPARFDIIPAAINVKVGG
ncbi:MAG: diacylglycerol kinase family lipid kinase [Candidatus Lindowbacteria bacterium]|nr:diacylglycerol kinase family lipid kinase [Candidatus Lindowbacteria bacterium]